MDLFVPSRDYPYSSDSSDDESSCCSSFAFVFQFIALESFSYCIEDCISDDSENGNPDVFTISIASEIEKMTPEERGDFFGRIVYGEYGDIVELLVQRLRVFSSGTEYVFSMPITISYLDEWFFNHDHTKYVMGEESCNEFEM